jgi:hypothetical protein
MVHVHWHPNAVVEARHDAAFVSIVGHEFTYLGQVAEKIVALNDGWPGEFDKPFESPVYSPHTND